jgi:hypothetical protein
MMMTGGCPAQKMDRNEMDEMTGENNTQIPLHCTYFSMNTLTWLFN